MNPAPQECASWSVASPNAATTRNIGEALGGLLQPGDLVGLVGELGSGKTTLCQGIGRGLGLDEGLGSPSYLLCNEYVTEFGVVFHLDAYFAARLESLLAEGLFERFDERAVVLIEWADQITSWLPDSLLRVDLHHTNEDQRLLWFRAGPGRPRMLLGLLAGSLQKMGISVEPTES